MQTTIELLNKALTIKRASRWSEKLDVDVATIAQAKKRGRLSPILAGGLAKMIGEPVEKWICIAALESERDSAIKSMLVKEAGKTWLFTSLVTWCKKNINDRRKHPRPAIA